MTLLARALAIALLLGTALLGAGAIVHPVLAGDAAAQLRTIGDTTHWRAIHLLMLAGSGLVAVGIWARLLLDREERLVALGAALVVISIGQVVNALNIAYMAGAGLHLATRFAAGDAMAAPLFDATHPIGLMAARLGNFVVALGALVLAGAERDRLLRALALIAGVGGLAGVLFFEESSRATLGAVALLAGWSLVVAVRAIHATTAGVGSRQ